MISRNSDRSFFPIAFMEAIMPNDRSPNEPVFKFTLGKLITIGIMNTVLGEVSAKVGVPQGSGYTAHSLRAAQPTAMALHSDMFSQAEIRASGRWRLDTADRCVRAKADVAE